METEQFCDQATLQEAESLWERAVEYLFSHAAIPAAEAAPGLENDTLEPTL